MKNDSLHENTKSSKDYLQNKSIISDIDTFRQSIQNVDGIFRVKREFLQNASWNYRDHFNLSKENDTAKESEELIHGK